MIKLKMTVKQMKALSAFCQVCINIARKEISDGGDVTILKIGDNNAEKFIHWDKSKRHDNIKKVAERHACIDEFEKLQWKLLQAGGRSSSSKPKAFSITKMNGWLILDHMERVVPIANNVFIATTLSIHSDTILKNLI